MRYFFHVVGTRATEQPVIDKHGEEFIQDEDAMSHAAAIARELAQDTSLDGFAILVTDERGQEIGQVPIVMRGDGS